MFSQCEFNLVLHYDGLCVGGPTDFNPGFHGSHLPTPLVDSEYVRTNFTLNRVTETKPT